MQYYLSKLTGNIYTSEYVLVPFDDTNESYQEYRNAVTSQPPTSEVVQVDSLPFELTDLKIKDYNERLQGLVADLRIKAKGLAIGKTGSNSYIMAQVDLYQRKFENATTLTPIPEIDTDLEAEGLRDFNMELSSFKSLIISMYNQGKSNENLIMCYIEQIRSAILTLINNEEWEKVDNAFALAYTLKEITTLTGAQAIKNQILAC